jgi:hypothetical protein
MDNLFYERTPKLRRQKEYSGKDRVGTDFIGYTMKGEGERS